jgi:DNA-binding NarL/FixJ family response regulator
VDNGAILTTNERLILEMVSDGFLNKEIAIASGRALSTVKNTLVLIYSKLGARNRAQAVAKIAGRDEVWTG